MIKILHVISDTNIGGAGRLLLGYLSGYSSTEFENTVLLPKNSMLTPRIRALGIPLYELNAVGDKSYDPAAVREIKKLIKALDPDIVHTHGSFSGRVAGKRCKKPVVFTRHSAFLPGPRMTKGLGKFIHKRLNERYADRIIAVSPICKQALTMGGVNGGMIDVIFNSVPAINPENRQATEKIRTDLGILPGEFTAGIIARIEPYKGQLFVVEAAKILKDGGQRIKIIIAGTGAQEDDVKNRARELGVEDIVVFAGFVSDVDSLLYALDVQINASTVEASSLSLLEGMSIGLPAVASNASGNPWVISDGENGLLFENKNPRDLADKLAEFVDSAELREALSQGALRIFKQKFSLDVFSKSTEETYKKALEAHTHGR